MTNEPTLRESLRRAGINPDDPATSDPAAWSTLSADSAGQPERAAIAGAIADGGLPSDVYRISAEQLGVLAGADGVRVFAFHDDTRAVPVGTWGATPELARVVSANGIPLDENTATGRAFLYGRAQRTPCSPDNRDPVMAWLGRLGVHHADLLPIVVRGERWGMLSLMFTSEEPPPMMESAVADLTSLMVIGAEAAESTVTRSDDTTRVA